MLTELVAALQQQQARVEHHATVDPAARPQEVATPDVVVQAVVKSSHEAYALAIALLEPKLMNPRVPVEQIDALGFGTEYRKAAAEAVQQYGAEGPWERHHARVKYRFQRFVQAAARGLK